MHFCALQIKSFLIQKQSVKMTAMPVMEDKAALVSQCQDFCQTLASKSPTFTFTLILGYSFSFPLDTGGKEALTLQEKKKKKTPSTLRRDARRRSEFLKKKLEVSTGDASSQSESVSEEEAIKEVVEKEVFKCEQCENIFKSENGLKIYVGKAHKKVNSIPSTPDRLRQQLMGSVSLSAPPSWTPAGRRTASIQLPWRRRRIQHHLCNLHIHLLHLTSALPSTHAAGESAS